MQAGGIERLAEAQGVYKVAMKAAAPSLLALRLAGDHARATPLFERAGQMFKVRAHARRR
jgi:hypothetical protein